MVDAGALHAHPRRGALPPLAGPAAARPGPRAALLVVVLAMATYLWVDDRQRHAQALVHNNTGVTFLDEERYAEARREFLAALALDPESAVVYSNLAEVDAALLPGAAGCAPSTGCWRSNATAAAAATARAPESRCS